jgi:type IV pilus assembly protein PilA
MLVIQRRMRAHHREEGFTLIELMVVVLIIAILIAVAIPIYVGLRERANDTAAKQGAVTSLKAAKAIHTDSDSYSFVTPAALEASEPELTYVPGGTVSSGPGVVSVNVPDSQTFVAAVYSHSTTCFFIRDDMTGTSYATLNTGTADCYASNATVSFGPSWP